MPPAAPPPPAPVPRASSVVAVDPPAQYAAAARAALATLEGTLTVPGLRAPVTVQRDTWGIPHIYAANTHDLFFAQGFTVAQDRMWQLEMWRRGGEGALAELLGPDYVPRDTFARLIAFRGDWDEEIRRYHPEARVILDAFAAGVNAAIRQALDSGKVPVEFGLMGFRPQPVWTARSILSRMHAWSLTRNAASEVQRALDIKALGLEKVHELVPTDPIRTIVVPDGLDLDDVDPAILEVVRRANAPAWKMAAADPASPTQPGPSSRPAAAATLAALEAQARAMLSPNPWLEEPDLGSNNWVIGGRKSATGKPLLANDPHRELVNPSLRYFVHLNAPGWNAIGATEPALPGISIGHNDRVAWAFTILGTDQQDLYVEEIDPENPNRYRADGAWRDMTVVRESIAVKGRSEPLVVDLKFTRHGPVLHENRTRQRAYALRWTGAEPGSAGYMGSLNVMQATDWTSFTEGLSKAWFVPSHSIVYADVDGNYGYVAAALTPIRPNWDGLLPVPGKDGKYEWAGFMPGDKLPRSLNAPIGFYNSSNNDVVPKIVPGYQAALGYEYSAPYRYDRVFEVLREPRRFSVADMERLQQDVLSLPARALVPLLKGKGVTTADPLARQAREQLLKWDFRMERDSAAAAIYAFWALKLAPLVFAPRVPPQAAALVRAYDMRRVIQWMQQPDRAYGATDAAARAGRDRILSQALAEAVAALRTRLGDDPAAWKWGDLHTADFVHPLSGAAGGAAAGLFQVDPVRRGGDSFTVMATPALTQASAKQVHGGSVMFVIDVKDWDNSTALTTPGNAAQPLGPHYKDLASPYWGAGKYFPLTFDRKKVDEVSPHRLELRPGGAATTSGELVR